MSFINAFFLFALGAAVLPVLYHLVRKVKAKRVVFSSLRFLKATPEELIRKRRLKDLLLMAMRAALFALLALVFARPFIPDEHIPFLSGEADRSVVILLDNSYSMQHGGAYEQALGAIRTRITEAGDDDEFALVLFNEEATQLTALSDEAAMHLSVLDQHPEPSNRTTDFSKPLRLAQDILAEARHEERQVVLVSDFQMNGWTGALENWKLNPEITLVPVKLDAGQDAADNAYIDAFHLSQKRTGGQVAMRFDARVAAEGAPAGQAKPVRLVLGEDDVDRQTAAPIASSQVTFQQVAGREGVFQGAIRLGDDALAVDNAYYFTYQVAGRPSLLVVDDAPRGRTRDAFFLERAFSLGEVSLFDFNAGTRDLLTRGGLRGHEAVFLTNLPALTSSQLTAVSDYVQEGGSVIISFGPRVDRASFSSHLAALGVGTVGERITARSVQAQDAIIGEVDLRHPVFDVFGATGTGAILRPQFRQYVRLQPDSSAAVIASFDTGDPFLVERTYGRGKVLVYTSTFNTAWTDFPVNELYLPFVYQLAGYALKSSERRLDYRVGEMVVMDGLPGQEWEVRAPGDRIYKVPVDDFGQAFFRQTDAPGNYLAARGREQYFFSVNIDPRESVLATRDADEAYAAVVPPPQDVATTPEQAAALAVQDEEKRQKLWRYLLLLAIGLFVAETILANRKARRVHPLRRASP